MGASCGRSGNSSNSTTTNFRRIGGMNAAKNFAFNIRSSWQNEKFYENYKEAGMISNNKCSKFDSKDINVSDKGVICENGIDVKINNNEMNNTSNAIKKKQKSVTPSFTNADRYDENIFIQDCYPSSQQNVSSSSSVKNNNSGNNSPSPISPYLSATSSSSSSAIMTSLSNLSLNPRDQIRLRSFYVRNQKAQRRHATMIEKENIKLHSVASLLAASSSSSSPTSHISSATTLLFPEFSSSFSSLASSRVPSCSSSPPSSYSSPLVSPSSLPILPPSASFSTQLSLNNSSRKNLISAPPFALNFLLSLHDSSSTSASSDKTVELYDIFSPDERSTRWLEFQELLANNKDEYDLLKHAVQLVRGCGKAMTIAAVRKNPNSKGGFPVVH